MRKLPRRKFLHLAAGAAALPAVSRMAWAQAYPTRPVYAKLNFDFLRDIAPVASISREASVMLVNPSFPAKAVPELIAYAKANPGKINMASAGNGAASHVAGELFKMMASIDMVHVPYRGGAPALT